MSDRLCVGGCGFNLNGWHGRTIYCPNCQRGPAIQRIAHSALSSAVKHGIIERLSDDIKCVDCGDVAKHYDHRDYSRPFDVEPVCIKCNVNRGWASDTPKILVNTEEKNVR